ncbi:hypothetical protein 2 [Beihai sobemo-like virus 5]|uniref:hypothetical protein 2 n=1 Tax=Beihai sobemo-like virus 5 TaxID=1922702 RepID=UPI00090AC91F|nr:hypothetical protein 2 [Beihai sobemo-like virus 5]APG75698.1 hypothetical protein 2 [Beihai sobemo-like virus 5]
MVSPGKRVKRTIRKQKAKVIKDVTLLRGIKQGVGMVVKRPFGSAKARPRRTANRGRNISKKAALCALTNAHLPLPRAVGAYTVVKTTTVIDSASRAMLFGTIKGNRSNHPDPAWYDTVAVTAGTSSTTAVGAADNAKFYLDTALASSGFASCRLVPAAFTVQVMCPKSLQTADGIVYIGRCKQVLDLMGNTRTWTTVMDDLVSYSSPRLCSAGKLALRGVKVDAIPNNMSQLSDFCPRAILTSSDTNKWTWGQGGVDAQFEGFAPIFVYNKNTVDLQYLVTVEWRVRFDPGNPAYAGHTFHPVSSDTCWSETLKGMEAEGHGVVDLAEGIADFGDAAMTAVGALL